MTLSIIIGTYGDDKWQQLAQAAAQSARDQVPPPHEVLHIHGSDLCAARYQGAIQATGRWLCFLDADDVLEPGFVAALQQQLAACPDHTLIQVATRYVTPEQRTGVAGLVPRRRLIDHNYLIVGTIISKRLFVSVGGFPQQSAAEDWALWLRCHLAGAVVVPAPEAVYQVITRPNGRNEQGKRTGIYHETRHKYALAWDACERRTKGPPPIADVVIVTKTANADIRRMTERCIASAIDSEPGLSLNVILVETHPDADEYVGVQMLRPPAEPLNYNRYLNVGVAHGRCPIVACCNNDLVFHKGWLSEQLTVFAAHPELHSLGSRTDGYGAHSRFSDGLYPGWRTSYEFSGWCFTLRRAAWQTIGQFSEQFQFWGADGSVVAQLQLAGLQHALNAASWVTHLHSRSHGLLARDELQRVTEGERLGIRVMQQQALQGSGPSAPGLLLHETPVTVVYPGTPYGVAGTP